MQLLTSALGLFASGFSGNFFWKNRDTVYKALF
jgi:hypothetical protein